MNGTLWIVTLVSLAGLIPLGIAILGSFIRPVPIRCVREAMPGR